MDPAVFAPFNPPQPNGGLYRPQYNGAGNSSVNAGGDHHRRPRFPSGGPTMSNTMSASNLPQGSKLATYMNRGNGNPNFNNTGNMSQLATDLNNLGLDPGTLKKIEYVGHPRVHSTQLWRRKRWRRSWWSTPNFNRYAPGFSRRRYQFGILQSFPTPATTSTGLWDSW